MAAFAIAAPAPAASRSLLSSVPRPLSFIRLPSCRRKSAALLVPLCISFDTASRTAPAAPAKDRLADLISSLKAIADVRERTKKLLGYGARLLPFPDLERTRENRVMGCTAQVWLKVELGIDGRIRLAADSDSEVTKGFCGVLVEALDMAKPQEVLAVSLDMVSGFGLGSTTSRSNTWYNVLLTIQKRTEMEVAKVEGRRAFELFPSLLISADDVSAQGSFAVAQAKYLEPNQSIVKELAKLLQRKQIGVVAHFYMDPEVQGVLVAAKEAWPHIFISDSLVMADRAVKMAEAGCKHIAVLGVDFMSENVRAILDKAGFQEVNVYRMSRESIGCSLAEAAENLEYFAFLEDASKKLLPTLHVVYINTSLETKARSHSIVPTITCTSSNVVPTVLQAFAEVPNLTVLYGPDSYMGANLAELFRQMSDMSDEAIAAIHPLHNKQSILSLLPRLHYYQNGTCIVHDLFGHEVVSRVRKGYRDAFLTAHFEVPGEMFELAMEAKQRGMGVVGSTQNILDFISSCVREAVGRGFDDKLQFVLGTETGMVTAIVKAVQKLLIAGQSADKGGKIEVEIVFPVSSEAIATVSSLSPHESSIAKLSIVPGVSSGEGCSISGGCASCPYMKMNSLEALLRVCNLIATPLEHSLDLQQAKRLNTSDISGMSVADLGCEPILHMRYFQSKGSLPPTLVNQLLSRHVKS